MEIMEVISDLNENELLDLAEMIYAIGYLDGKAGRSTDETHKRRVRLKCRIEDWLEIGNG